ncbi:hypothetical protein BX285_1018 [Streptomyces sp. 1114.5]|uniref:hypothetical protein n=1 Tax=unclassified Streptomyces TaxID=2593676 RepID=UPI000BD2AC85|nr:MULTISPECIES: hypothetical protein [unclassified Streptomyces]RKT16671.1 hypothetical protein BX285_1018 [Streptomyces sp. 1114.5]SOB82842.1 hypothetical protein SAMN06272789_3026 [Streptomyces sp. 1331.2]
MPETWASENGGYVQINWTPPFNVGETQHLIKLGRMWSAPGDSGGAVIYGTKAVGTLVCGSLTSPFSYVQPLSTVAQDLHGDISTVSWAQW